MVTGINHITLSVRNLEESFLFYKNILGFKPLMRSRKMAYFLAGDVWLCLDEDKSARSAPLPEYTHIAFSVTAEEFLHMSAKLKAADVKIWKDNESEGESLYFLDSNGHKLELHVGDWRSRITSIRQDPWEAGIEFFC